MAMPRRMAPNTAEGLKDSGRTEWRQAHVGMGIGVRAASLSLTVSIYNRSI